MPHALAFNPHSRFCMNDYFAKMCRKIACNMSSIRYGGRLQVIQSFASNTAVFESSGFIFTYIKYI